jgi:hypothetical protein
VLKDVREEKLTADYARREYGVVIDVAEGKVLAEETARLRAKLGVQTASASSSTGHP